MGMNLYYPKHCKSDWCSIKRHDMCLGKAGEALSYWREGRCTCVCHYPIKQPKHMSNLEWVKIVALYRSKGGSR